MKGSLIAVVASFALCHAASAWAQSGPGRPYRALFGGATTDPTMHQSLDVTLSVAQVYDDNALADSGGTRPASALQVSGFYTSLSPGVSYKWSGRQAQFNTTIGSSLRYYAKQQEFIGSSYFAGVGFSSGFGRSQLAASQTESYSPVYLFGLLPSLSPIESVVPAQGSDLATSGQNMLLSSSALTLTHGLSTRSTISALANYQFTTYTGATSGQDLRSFGFGGRYGYNLTKSATLHFGYIYRGGQHAYGSAQGPTAAHDIDAGVDYHRALSFSRRTQFDFRLGSSLLNSPETADSRAALQYRAVGTATLSHDMGRTWRARLAYNRGAGFVGGFTEPIFSDALIASLRGFLTRRVDFDATGGFSVGSVGLSSTPDDGFRTYTATSKLRIALNPVSALFGEYLYYYYDLGKTVVTPFAMPSTLDRNSVRIGLALWLPLVRR